MIVRDHAPVIERCLATVRDVIDYWVIVDTGSEDDTTALVNEALGDVPGELHHSTWVDSSTNRNEALALARGRGDFLLLIDAEMTLIVDDPDFRDQLVGDGYFVRCGTSIREYTPRLIRNSPGWTYHGVTREYLLPKPWQDPGRLDAIHVLRHESPAERRSRDARDMTLLSGVLASHPGDCHALYHLGHLYAGTQDHEKALDCFERLLSSGVEWAPEWIWDAALQRGRLLEALGRPPDAVAEAYLQAYERRHWRPEPLYYLALFERKRGQYARAQLYGHRAMQIGEPAAERGHLDTTVYRWQLPVEYALSCYRLGLHEEAVRAANRALESGDLPRNVRDSVIASRQRSVEAIYDAQPRPDDAGERNRIRVVVPFHNARKFLPACIDSLARQDYDHFKATFIDDASTDGSGDLVPGDDPRFELIRNEERIGALCNRARFIDSCAPRDIVVYLDGDDRLACDDALRHINDFYNRHDCWMSYGQFMTQHGAIGWARPYASRADLVRDLETGLRFPIHALTHRAALFHRIAAYDPDYDCFKDSAGEWLFYASDAVIALPLFRLAGWQRVRFNSRVIYLYTDQHASSESVLNRSAQMQAVSTAHLKPALPVQAGIYD